MMRMLAQLDAEGSAGKWFLLVSIIMVIGALSILVVVVVGVGRRWKRRQLKAIDQDRAERRAKKTGERVDAWQASSDRYVDRDKLPQDDDLFERDDAPAKDDTDHTGPYDDPEQEDRDPFGLFADAPFQEADDEDDEDDDFDDEGDWDEEDDETR